MIRLARCSIGAMVIIVASGCSNLSGRPPVGGIKTDEQLKLSSAAHWGVIANDIAEQVHSKLSSSAYAKSPIWIPTLQSDPVFHRAIAYQLRSALLSRGFRISTDKKYALTLRLATEEVSHYAPKTQLGNQNYRPGTLTMIGAGVLVLREVQKIVKDLGISAVVGLGATEFGLTKITPTTELLISTSIEDNGEYLMHKSDVYYVDQVNAGLYSESGTNFRVVGESSQ